MIFLVASLSPAGATEGFHCKSIHDVDLSPGLSIRPSSGTVKSQGYTIECHGRVKGHDPTGPGPYYEEGRYGIKDPDTCQDGGEGDGVFSFTIPTTDGEQKLTGAFTFTYGDPSTKGGLVHGEFEGDDFRGTLEVTPLRGNCVTEPVTRIRVDADFFFSR